MKFLKLIKVFFFFLVYKKNDRLQSNESKTIKTEG